jgi:hypothetical protein
MSMLLIMYWICTHISQYIGQIIINQSGAVVMWLIVQSRDRAFDPHKCLNILLGKLFTMMSGRCYLCKIAIQTDNPGTTLSAYIPASVDAIVETNMAVGHHFLLLDERAGTCYVCNGSIALSTVMYIYHWNMCIFTHRKLLIL